MFEISTDKVDAEIPSPIAGVLNEIKVEAGATVGINTIVAVIGESGGSSAPAEAAPQPATVAAPQAEAPPEVASIDVIMPQMGESIFEGTITKWLKQVGDKVERG